MKKILLLLLLLIATGYAFWHRDSIHPQQIQAMIQATGPWAPLSFLALFSLAPFAPFLSGVLAIGGGMAFGLWYGSLLVLLGASLSATVGYYMGRFLGHGLAEKKRFLSAWSTLQQTLSRHDFYCILLLRLLPLVPFDVISYGAGFSRIPYKKYIVATIFGMSPGIIVFTNIGSSALHPASWEFFFALAMLVLLCVGAFMLKKKVERRLGASTFTDK